MSGEKAGAIPTLPRVPENCQRVAADGLDDEKKRTGRICLVVHGSIRFFLHQQEILGEKMRAHRTCHASARLELGESKAAAVSELAAPKQRSKPIARKWPITDQK